MLRFEEPEHLKTIFGSSLNFCYHQSSFKTLSNLSMILVFILVVKLFEVI